MPKSKATIVVTFGGTTQSITVVGTDPSIQQGNNGLKVIISAGDGRIVDSSIRAIQLRENVQSIQFSETSMILLQKET